MQLLVGCGCTVKGSIMQEVGDPVFTDCCLYLCLKCIQFTGKNKAAILFIIIQWFFSGAVTGQEEAVVPVIIDRKGKHSVKIMKTGGAQFQKSEQNGFRIRMSIPL